MEEYLRLFQEMGDKWGLPCVLHSLGDLARLQGDVSVARAHYEQALQLSRQIGEKRAVAHSLHGLGLLAQSQGDRQAARAFHEESLTVFREIRHGSGMMGCLEGLAVVAGAQGEWERAARLFGAAKALRRAMAAPLSARECTEVDRHLTAVRVALGEAAFAAAWAAGRALTLERAIAEALEGAGQPAAVSAQEAHVDPAAVLPASRER
jgi:tetratricopeptide (TPR) repeat protein